jgi:tRNA threonylcarbamoyladenosine biosynthesis protein TsaB
MLILALDTSTAVGSLAIVEDLRVIREAPLAGEDPYSSRLFRHLDSLLAEANLELQAFDLFAVAAGPGSFTGLRVGLTAAKGWAEVFGKPIAAVNALEAVAAQSKSAGGLIAPFLDARRGEVYGGLYERRGEQLESLSETVVMSPTEYLAWLRDEAGVRDTTLASPTPNVLAAYLTSTADRTIEIEVVSAALAPVIGKLGYAKAQRGKLADALTLDADYVRRSDAEVLWKTSA